MRCNVLPTLSMRPAAPCRVTDVEGIAQQPISCVARSISLSFSQTVAQGVLQSSGMAQVIPVTGLAVVTISATTLRHMTKHNRATAMLKNIRRCRVVVPIRATKLTHYLITTNKECKKFIANINTMADKKLPRCALPSDIPVHR